MRRATERGVAGASARAVFEQGRRRRRRRLVEVGVWLAVAAMALAVGVTLRAVPAAAVGLAALVVAAARRPTDDPDRWRRGADGEVATAGLLDALPGRRWVVLHDRALPGSRANVDHLVIGRRGVWVIDSKAFRARLRPGWRSVRVGDRRLDTSVAAWEASVVAEVLGTEVRPLLAVHGTGLPPRGRRCDGVRVVPAGAVTARLRRERFGPRLGRSAREELGRRAAAALPPAWTPPSGVRRRAPSGPARAGEPDKMTGRMDATPQ